MQSQMMTLDEAILEAHARGAGEELAELYIHAADNSERSGDVDACCYFLTQAYVFALESGSDLARGINQRLVAQGREEPLAHEN